VPAEEWKEMHRGEYLEVGDRDIVGAEDDGRDAAGEPPQKPSGS
jgi:hypothetical protein